MRPRHLDVEPVRGAAGAGVDTRPRERGLRPEAGRDPGAWCSIASDVGARAGAGAGVTATAVPAASPEVTSDRPGTQAAAAGARG